MSFNAQMLSVVIVNFNGGREILACLATLSRETQTAEFEVIVVDNGSSDGSPAQIETQFPHVKLLQLNENRGFAAACNAGMRVASGGNILLLNPDTEVRPHALYAMLSALNEHITWGIVGARMLNSRGEAYRGGRRLPQVRDLVYSVTGLARLFSNSRRFNGYLYGERPLESLDEVEQVEGSCLLITERARQTVGELDERYFIFFEEVDWCKRVRDAGFEIHIVNTAEVVHHVSTTMGRYYERTRETHAQSAMKYFRKHHGVAGYRSLRRAMSKALFVRAALTAIPALLNVGNMRRRFAGTLRERRAYLKGLSE